MNKTAFSHRSIIRLAAMVTLAVLLGAVQSMAQQHLAAPSPPPEVNWNRLATSIAAHGAATGFDSWTSWQRRELNSFLADNGRFTAKSAGKKAGLFAGAALVQVVVVKKWGKRHPWLEKAFSIANFTSAGMFTAAGAHNLTIR